MQKVTIEQIVRDAHAIKIDPTTSDHIAYPEFVGYFADVQTITRHHLIIGANFTYGWMPRMLEFKSEEFDACVGILNKVKRGVLITEDELETLRNLIDHSVVGASKLLHFIAPDRYAIWDSRVYKYINGRESAYHMSKPENYFKYLDNCQELVRHRNFPSAHESIMAKLRTYVSPLRAIELVMYIGGGSQRQEKRSPDALEF